MQLAPEPGQEERAMCLGGSSDQHKKPYPTVACNLIDILLWIWFSSFWWHSNNLGSLFFRCPRRGATAEFHRRDWRVALWAAGHSFLASSRSKMTRAIRKIHKSFIGNGTAIKHYLQHSILQYKHSHSLFWEKQTHDASTLSTNHHHKHRDRRRRRIK